MLEIPEYPYQFRKNFFSHVADHYEKLTCFLINHGCEIIPGEDKERFGKDDLYHYGNVRNEIFVEKMMKIKPRFFLVGCSHLDCLREKLSEYDFVNLVNEKRDIRLKLFPVI